MTRCVGRHRMRRNTKWAIGCATGFLSSGGEQLTISDQRHHAIDYIELPVTDLERAKGFYSAAFDWSFNDYGPEYAGIRNTTGSGEYGGFRRVDEVLSGGPLVVLYSIDLERSLEAVRNAGGEVTKEIFAFPGGRRFQFLDPSGNELAVWSDQ